MTEEEKRCAKCVYCEELNMQSHDGYEGYCNKMGYYLKTIDDRLCEKYEEDLR